MEGQDSKYEVKSSYFSSEESGDVNNVITQEFEQGIFDPDPQAIPSDDWPYPSEKGEIGHMFIGMGDILELFGRTMAIGGAICALIEGTGTGGVLFQIVVLFFTLTELANSLDRFVKNIQNKDYFTESYFGGMALTFLFLYVFYYEALMGETSIDSKHKWLRTVFSIITISFAIDRVLNRIILEIDNIWNIIFGENLLDIVIEIDYEIPKIIAGLAWIIAGFISVGLIKNKAIRLIFYMAFLQIALHFFITWMIHIYRVEYLNIQ